VAIVTTVVSSLLLRIVAVMPRDGQDAWESAGSAALAGVIGTLVVLTLWQESSG
jgi:hypothetical protein